VTPGNRLLMPRISSSGGEEATMLTGGVEDEIRSS
jgi:hypothetical protein